MEKIHIIKPVYLDGYMPDEMHEGVLYISLKFKLAIHLCACGCKEKTVTPINTPGEWKLADYEGLVTLRPSIGNFSGQKPYHAHYYITNNLIEWLD